MLDKLLDVGADADAATTAGDSPLLAACARGHVSCAATLLRRRPNLATSSPNRNGDTALSVSAARGLDEVVETLLAHQAARFVEAAATLMLAAAPPPPAQTPGGAPADPLSADAAAAVDAETPALATTSPSATLPLTDVPAPTAGEAVEGSPVVAAGRRFDNVRLALAALSALAAPPAPALGAALAAAAQPYLAAVNAANAKGVAPLGGACAFGSARTAWLLLAAGADVRRADANGATPLMVAAHCGQTACVAALLDHASKGLPASVRATEPSASAAAWGAVATPDQGSVGAAALRCAASSAGSQEWLDASDGSGATAVWLAAAAGADEVVALLLQAGAAQQGQVKGVSAKAAAARNGHAKCAALLD